MASGSSSNSVAPDAGRFALTRWSVVLAAGGSQSARGRDALEQLCRIYWHPIYFFVRRQGHSPPDAEDLTQEFFARLLQKNSLEQVTPSRGRFRSFLLASLKHFLANEWDKAGTQKRGRHPVFIPLYSQAVEGASALELEEQTTPERVFERRWALTLLEQVLNRLGAEYARAGKAELFASLKSTLTQERAARPYTELAAGLRSSEGAVKVAAHRLRQRYRELVREEIAQTVARPQEVDEELQALFAALANPGVRDE